MLLDYYLYHYLFKNCTWTFFSIKKDFEYKIYKMNEAHYQEESIYKIWFDLLIITLP